MHVYLLQYTDVDPMAGLWCVGRQKQFQPLAVLAGFSGGAAGLGLWLLPNFRLGLSRWDGV